MFGESIHKSSFPRCCVVVKLRLLGLQSYFGSRVLSIVGDRRAAPQISSGVSVCMCFVLGYWACSSTLRHADSEFPKKGKEDSSEVRVRLMPESLWRSLKLLDAEPSTHARAACLTAFCGMDLWLRCRACFAWARMIKRRKCVYDIFVRKVFADRYDGRTSFSMQSSP